METPDITSPNRKFEKIVSVIFHPLFIPLYGMLIIFTAPTLFWYIPIKVKMILLIVIVINNILIPISLMPFLRYKNIINSWIIETKRERIIPLLTISLFYTISSVIMFRLPVPSFLKGYIFATAIVAIALTTTNFWWKISLHSAGMGALVGTVLVLSVRMMVPLTWFLLPLILISGIVLYSRLKLNSHNSLQVYLGFLTGIALITACMLFF